MMYKKELIERIKVLEERIEANKENNQSYMDDLMVAQKQLKDVDKPVLTPAQFDAVEEAILEGVEEFDFSDSDNYTKEFEIGYDNTVGLSSIDLDDHHCLANFITECVHKLFAEAECPDE